MIVVAIIGILAAIAIPQYQSFIARTQVAEALTLVAPVKLAVAEYDNLEGGLPPSGSIMGLDPTLITGDFVSSMSWTKIFTASVSFGTVKPPEFGAIIIRFGSSAHEDLSGRGFFLCATKSSGKPITWRCVTSCASMMFSFFPTPTAVDNEYLPSGCQ